MADRAMKHLGGAAGACVMLLLMVFMSVLAETNSLGIADQSSKARCTVKKYKHCYNLEYDCPVFCPEGACTVECVSCTPICTQALTGRVLEEGPEKQPKTEKPKEDPEKQPKEKPKEDPEKDPKEKPKDDPEKDPKEKPKDDNQNDHKDDNGKDHKGDNGNDHKDEHGKKEDPEKDPKKKPKEEPTPPPEEVPTPPPSEEVPTPPPSEEVPAPPPLSTPPPPTPPVSSTPPSEPSPSTPPVSSPPPPPPPPDQPTTPPASSTPPSETTPPTPPVSSTPSEPTPTPPASSTPPSEPTPPTPPSESTPPSPSSSSSPPSPPTPTTPSTPSTPSPTPSSSSPKRAKCKDPKYTHCYNMEHVCPRSCPGECEVDCDTCKPICKCDKPGTVCQDPRFIGGDGITFYFHGKKDRDFCLLSDSNLHINAHFIGRRNQNMKRDFTWVQSIGVLFNNHQIFVGAQKTVTWDDSIDHLALSFDGEPIFLPEAEGAKWQPTAAPTVSITRSRETNGISVEVEGNFKITVTVVPITEEEARVHNYGITKEECFAHLDLGFKFYSLSDDVNGVLGQTYGKEYVSRVKMGVSMPIMGGDRKFATSSLFATDCAVARFGGGSSSSSSIVEYAILSCGSGIYGRGVVCKR